MKLYSMRTWKVKKAQLTEWHRWFAWRPIFVTSGDVEQLLWLETVWRKGRCDPWYEWPWEYKRRNMDNMLIYIVLKKGWGRGVYSKIESVWLSRHAAGKHAASFGEDEEWEPNAIVKTVEVSDWDG